MVPGSAGTGTRARCRQAGCPTVRPLLQTARNGRCRATRRAARGARRGPSSSHLSSHERVADWTADPWTTERTRAERDPRGCKHCTSEEPSAVPGSALPEGVLSYCSTLLCSTLLMNRSLAVSRRMRSFATHVRIAQKGDSDARSGDRDRINNLLWKSDRERTSQNDPRLHSDSPTIYATRALLATGEAQYYLTAPLGSIRDSNSVP